MNFREKFLNDLSCKVVIKGDKTFKQLATLYGYPKDNGVNLCKKDYYKFIANCNPTKTMEIWDKPVWKPMRSVDKIVRVNTEDSTYENLVLKSKWQVQTKGGNIETLKSYKNDVTPVQISKFREDLINDLKAYSPVNKYTFKGTKTNRDNLLLISLPDFHVGRETLSMDIVDNYIGVINNIINKTDMSTIEQIVYVIGNDFFNSDNGLNYSTFKGTPQFDFNTWTETWAFGKNLLLHSIEFLKQFNLPLEVINVPGNHDTSKMFYLGDVLDAYFKNDEQVNIVNDTKLFKKYVYGNTLMMFEHGEMREGDYPLIMASEFPKEWGNSKYRYTFCGHLHHLIAKEYRGNCFVKFLPSLAKSSTWETSKGYKTSPKAEASIINKEEGLVYTINVNII